MRRGLEMIIMIKKKTENFEKKIKKIKVKSK